MSPTEKISRFIAEQGMPDTAFAKLSKIPKSVLSRILKSEVNLTLTQGRRAADAMGVDMGWLYNEQAGWPPPVTDDRVILTPAERTILTLAHQVSTRKGIEDETLEPARQRLLGMLPEPASIIPEGERPAEPRGPSYRDTRKAGPAATDQPAKGPRRNAR